MLTAFTNSRLFFLTFFLLICLLASGQSETQKYVLDGITVETELIADAGLIAVRNLTVSSAGSTGREVRVDPVGSPNAGMMKITGATRRAVKISFLPFETLYSDQEDSGKVEVTYQLSGCASENQSASVLFETPNTVVTLHETTGLYFLWIGGIFDLSMARSGRYRSQFVLTIDDL
jgi:hypothetical protein